MRATAVLFAFGTLLHACADEAPFHDVDLGPDAGRDVTAPQDVFDAAPDLSVDASVDVARDVTALDFADATRDAQPDSATDGVARDVMPDVAPDAATDVATTDVVDGAATDGAAPDADASAGDAGAERTLACVDIVAPEASAGLALDARFWPGFRFELTGSEAVQLVAVGLEASVSGGSLHASLVRLTGPSDTPDLPDLTSSDVVARTLIEFPSGGGRVIQSAPLMATLTPGWYALVFGTGAFGATATSASIPSAGGSGCSLPGSSFPFTIRQSDGMFILQGASPRMFVQVRP